MVESGGKCVILKPNLKKREKHAVIGQYRSQDRLQRKGVSASSIPEGIAGGREQLFGAAQGCVAALPNTLPRIIME